MWREEEISRRPRPLARPRTPFVQPAPAPCVLLAEDDRAMRSLLTYSLKRAGYRVVTCEDGWELLSHLGSYLMEQQEHEDIDVVVSDIRMPGVTGLEVLEGAREATAFPPMILITAFGDDWTHDEAERLGARAILDKPFDVDALLDEVRRVAPIAGPDDPREG